MTGARFAPRAVLLLAAWPPCGQRSAHRSHFGDNACWPCTLMCVGVSLMLGSTPMSLCRASGLKTEARRLSFPTRTCSGLSRKAALGTRRMVTTGWQLSLPAAARLCLLLTYCCSPLNLLLHSTARLAGIFAAIKSEVTGVFYDAARYFLDEISTTRCSSRCCFYLCRLLGSVEVQGGNPGSQGGASASRIPLGCSGRQPAHLAASFSLRRSPTT